METRPARQMSNDEIESEIGELIAKWDDLRKDLEESGGMSGSPGEWMVERMDELETERLRRDAARTVNG
jgi:hypothetical protein